ncbi:WecB/TagA/CpsF family glycosyltransferase [uncultured Clostridium sp.]|uniref:WecB/TagA/CpsF family glycosyltransferase n=1 Tax=uncultured Clostridium sp. TaxID=59620 RepID=UPI002600A243|nr:WecB/TagA/CpsF family glycosyltransferase [uncultured Clostridium sp.]
MYTKILGYKVFNGTKEEFIKEILKRNKSNIISGNPEILFNGLNDEKLNSTFNAEDAIIIPDGVGTVIASKLVKDPVKEKIAGIEVMHEVLLQSVKEGKGIYLLGAEEEVLQSCVKNIKRDIKGINIVGVHNGFFDLNNCEDLINDIKSKNPWAIFVAMGSPRQEKFINLIKDDTNCKVYMGVGGSFDIFAGKLTRAPKWMQKLGLEWVHRVVREPWRIKRLGAIPKFLFLVVKNR